MSVTAFELVLTIALLLPSLELARLADVARSIEASQASRSTQEEPRVNLNAKVMAAFEERLKAYVALHRKVEATLPGLPRESTPEKINAHQMALAQLIAKARAKSEVGDIFDKDTRALFRRYLARVFAGPQGRELRATIMDDNPGRLRLHLNGRYPESVPVSTVPPQVLEALPKLPEDLEYRFIGDRLILHDIHAHTIVDYIDSVFGG